MSYSAISGSNGEIVLYNYALSPCGEKVRFALAEKGLRWMDRPIDLGRKENLTKDFLRISPKGLVPVLVHDGTAIIESTVINEYIDETWPKPALKPGAPPARARMRLWTKLVDETLHPAWPGIAWPILVRPVWLLLSAAEVAAMLDAIIDPARRTRQERLFREGFDAPDARESVAVFTRVCAEMETALARSAWLAGDSFSLADIALLPYFFALDVFGLGDFFADSPAVRRWYDRSCRRPAYGGDPRTLFAPERLKQVRDLAIEASSLRHVQGKANRSNHLHDAAGQEAAQRNPPPTDYA